MTSAQTRTAAASDATPVLAIAFSTPGATVVTTAHPLPAPDTDVNTDLQSNTVAPTTSGAIVATLFPTVTTPSITDPTSGKSKPKKNIPPKKKTEHIKPPKINTKKSNALKNATRSDLPKTNPKKKMTDLPRSQEEAVTEKTRANAKPKKPPPANTTPKKSTPKKPLPKKAPPKTKPKKDVEPKTNTKKPAPAKAKLPKNPKSGSKKLQSPQAKRNQTKVPEKRTNPGNETFETTTLSHLFLTSTRKPEATKGYSTSTVPSSTGSRLTTVDTDSTGPTTRARAPLWYPDGAAETPSGVGDATPTQSTSAEDANMSSGTTPHGDVPVSVSGDVPVTSGAILSGDDMALSFSNVGVVSDSMVLDDGLTMVIPTIHSEDMTDVSSSPWLDQSEFIPVNIPVPATLSDQTTAAPTTGKRAVHTSTQRPQRRPDDTNDNNLIDIYNKNSGADGDVSQDNLIPKRRVNLRERTKNKRIQELLEEKRNFLLRMKRGHAA